jgi:uncharacterized protein
VAHPQKVVLDTNILISALIHQGTAREFVYLLLYNQIKIVSSNYIIKELETVLKKNKFKNKTVFKQIETLLKKETLYVKIKPKLKTSIVKDPKDHPILQTTQKSQANFIITGDKNLLSLKKAGKIKVVSMNQLKSKLISFEK